jgi:hypothetical protein
VEPRSLAAPTSVVAEPGLAAALPVSVAGAATMAGAGLDMVLGGWALDLGWELWRMDILAATF